MKFGELPLNQCEGSLLAHSTVIGGKRLRKGHLLTQADIAAAAEQGLKCLIVAQLEQDDVLEDEAAEYLAKEMAPDGFVFSGAGTGRVNFYAETNGVFCVESALVNQINEIDPGITLATLAQHEPVMNGRMVATVKIIPYAVNGKALDAASEFMAKQPFKVAPFVAHRVGVISTTLPHLKASVISKTLRVLEDRLRPSGSEIVTARECEHTAEALAAVFIEISKECDLIIVFGASAISDPADVIPAGLKQAGGEVERVGMPVDPGNLLMLGSFSGKPVIGAPGCARSPARNGFDFVLERLLSGVGVSSDEIAGMGVGGLLMEIGSRPQPRETSGEDMQVSAIVLAAGQSRRMGAANKLTLDVDGIPMVRHVTHAAESACDHLIVVTGHDHSAIASALEGIDYNEVHNPDYPEGLASSLRAGVLALPKSCTHAAIVLGDMPGIGAKHLERLVQAAKDSPAGSIIMATHDGKRGNPVIWPGSYFEALKAISGDTGARHLLGENRERIVEVELGEAASIDLDTPEAYEAWKGRQR